MLKKELKQMESLLLVKKNILLRGAEKRVKKYRDANSEKMTDIAEIASSASDGDVERIIAEEDARELKQIEDALARIKAGHYGVCEQCSRPIKKARLKAIPFATLCVSCKEEEEKECGDKSAQTKYDWESTIGSSENGEMEEINKKYSGRKIAELELDDSKN
ncbi:MAG: TraR/DksA family transcriptional regulator [Planctomycetes bacterium]|nr:TraR/DksA family transcriptional regulator [Planctomycetota bacterium]